MCLKQHQIWTKHEIYRIIPILIARCVKHALCIRTFRTGIIAACIRRNYFDLTSKVDDVQRRFLCAMAHLTAIRHEKSFPLWCHRSFLSSIKLFALIRPALMLVPIINDLSSRVYLWSRRIAKESSNKKPTADFQGWPQGPSHISDS